MKKTLFAAVLTVATAMGGYHYYNTTGTENLSDIAQANIEALASLPVLQKCYKTVTDDGGVSATIYCGTCFPISGRGVSEDGNPDGECSR
ncbi:MAG: hypothetical protein IJM43_01045 [Bacteroidaceae bacterium]|nr:hypothetical protein [Bacteroidaceae bacterium]